MRIYLCLSVCLSVCLRTHLQPGRGVRRRGRPAAPGMVVEDQHAFLPEEGTPLPP